MWQKEIIGRVGTTSIFVTHDLEEAVEVADTVIVRELIDTERFEAMMAVKGK